MSLFHRIVGFVCILLILSCDQQKEKKFSKEEIAEKNNSLVRVNRFLVRKDTEIIESFVKRRKWEMNTTEEGLWYMIYEKGDGKQAEKNKIAILNYSLSLLDGTICYESDSLGVKKFKIGQGGVEPGLESGVLLLREGDKARFILPPHLAHGLMGDNNKIPPRSIIIYDLELLTITD